MDHAWLVMKGAEVIAAYDNEEAAKEHVNDQPNEGLVIRDSPIK
jgi:hypothetical protein